MEAAREHGTVAGIRLIELASLAIKPIRLPLQRTADPAGELADRYRVAVLCSFLVFLHHRLLLGASANEWPRRRQTSRVVAGRPFGASGAVKIFGEASVVELGARLHLRQLGRDCYTTGEGQAKMLDEARRRWTQFNSLAAYLSALSQHTEMCATGVVHLNAAVAAAATRMESWQTCSGQLAESRATAARIGFNVVLTSAELAAKRSRRGRKRSRKPKELSGAGSDRPAHAQLD